MDFVEQLNLFLNKRLNSKYICICEHTPEILQKIGIKDYPILMETRGLKKAIADRGNTGDNYHDLGIDGISQLPKILESPAIVLNSLSHPKESVVVVSETQDNNGNPIVVPIKLNQKANYNFVEVDSNVVMTAYGRASFGDFLKDNIAAQTILLADKEKSQRLLDSGLQLPITLDSTNIIRLWDKDVNQLEQRISVIKAHKLKEDGVYEQMYRKGLDELKISAMREENTMDETNTNESNKTTEARAEAQRLVQETGEPHVTIEFSENPAFESGDVLPLSVADKKLATLDGEHEGDGYDKIFLSINYIKDGKPDSYEGCRFDIGDEHQGLVAHIQDHWQFYLENKNWRKHLEGDHSADYVKAAYEEYERMANEVAPFFKRHVELAEMLERAQSVADFTQEDIDNVRSHVAEQRAELNGTPSVAANGEHEEKDDVIERVTPKVSTPTDGVDKSQEPASYRDKVTEIRDTMIQAILARIEKDPLNWTAGWNKVSGNPVNGKTDTAYRGLNSIYLYLMSELHGYNDPRWVTFNQAKSLGASIKKGEKSFPVLFYERYDKLTKKEYDLKTTKSMTDEERAEYERENVRFVLRYYSVFNAQQCVNFPELDKSALQMSEEERANQNELIETIIANSAAPVNYDGGNRAYYQLSTDSIHLPAIENFHSMQDYYATALHEIAHSTGHASRLNRDMSGGFGSPNYAVEELRAELACVFMQIEHGLNIEGKHVDNHAAYVQSWLDAAKSDPAAFYKAVRDAGKIADYVDDNYLQAMVSYVKEQAAEEIKAEERANVNNLEENVREWYTSTFPTDELGDELDGGLTFGDVVDALNKGENIYDVLGVQDTIVRESVFRHLAELQDKPYSEIYDAWLHDDELREKREAERREEYEYRAMKIILNNARNGEPLAEDITFQDIDYLINTRDLILKYGGEERNGDYVITPAVEEKFAKLQSKYEKGEHKEKISPIYQKYIETQRKYPNAFIFQRVGDFYEVIGETAKEVASRLDLTLTARDIGLANRTPMCGVPYHAIDEYVTKLREFGDIVIERAEGRFEELKQRVEPISDEQLEGQTSIFDLPEEQEENKEKLSREEKRVRQYADALKKIATEIGVKVNSDDYYLKKAREEIAEYEQSDEYKQAVREDFPNDFIDDDDSVKDMAGTPQNEPVEEQEKKREWFTVELPDGCLGKQYGANTMIKMPKGEYAYYSFFVPTKLVKNVNGKSSLRIASDFTYRLNNDGRQVELTGLELRDSLSGMQIGKEYKRVAPSRMYAKTFAALERNVPAEMKALPNWCVYRTFQREDKDKKGKVLKSAVTGEGASSKRKTDWTDFDTALKYAKENGFAGVSFLLEAKNGITCIDLDECISNPETGEMKERVAKLVGELKGTYMERSTSGNGVHIFLKDDILNGGKYQSTSVNSEKGDLEVYDDNRVISMTGDMFSETNNLTRSGSAATYYLRGELGEQRHNNNVGVTRPQPTSGVSLSDNELITRIRASKKGLDFDNLYSGKGLSGNKSNDDAKLAHLLLYFNGGDKDQAFRIMRESGAHRPDKPDSYYHHTIEAMDSRISEYAKHPTHSPDNGQKRGGNSKRYSNDNK